VRRDDNGGVRSTIVIILLAGLLAVAAGCAGEESASTCDNLEDLQASVTALRDIEPSLDALDDVRALADDIEAELAETKGAAEEELGDELDGFDGSLQALRADFDAAEAEGFSRATLTALVTSASNAFAAFEALIAAAPDCDL